MPKRSFSESINSTKEKTPFKQARLIDGNVHAASDSLGDAAGSAKLAPRIIFAFDRCGGGKTVTCSVHLPAHVRSSW